MRLKRRNHLYTLLIISFNYIKILGKQALMRKIMDAKKSNSPTVEIWGTGKPLREFLHVDDLADALVFLMHH